MGWFMAWFACSLSVCCMVLCIGSQTHTHTQLFARLKSAVAAQTVCYVPPILALLHYSAYASAIIIIIIPIRWALARTQGELLLFRASRARCVHKTQRAAHNNNNNNDDDDDDELLVSTHLLCVRMCAAYGALPSLHCFLSISKRVLSCIALVRVECAAAVVVVVVALTLCAPQQKRGQQQQQQELFLLLRRQQVAARPLALCLGQRAKVECVVCVVCERASNREGASGQLSQWSCVVCLCVALCTLCVCALVLLSSSSP